MRGESELTGTARQTDAVLRSSGLMPETVAGSSNQAVWDPGFDLNSFQVAGKASPRQGSYSLMSGFMPRSTRTPTAQNGPRARR